METATQWKAPVKGDAPLHVISGQQPPNDIPDEVAESRTFYSRSAGLQISVDKGHRVVIDGEYRRVDEFIVQFEPQANNWGVFTTKNRKAIAFLEKRMAEPGSDIVSPEQYNRSLLGDKEVLRQTEEMNSRLLEDRNRLLALLKEKEQQSK